MVFVFYLNKSVLKRQQWHDNMALNWSSLLYTIYVFNETGFTLILTNSIYFVSLQYHSHDYGSKCFQRPNPFIGSLNLGGLWCLSLLWNCFFTHSFIYLSLNVDHNNRVFRYSNGEMELDIPDVFDINCCVLSASWGPINILTEKTHRENRQKSKKQSRNLSNWSSIAQIWVASADIGVVFFHDSLIAVIFGVFFLFIFFPCASSDYPNFATNVLVDFTAHSCTALWNSVFCLNVRVVTICDEGVGVNQITIFGVMTKGVITLRLMHAIAYVTTYSFSISKGKKHAQCECQHT